MFEGKPLSEVTYEDLKGFLELRRAEGEDLDYKQAWKEEILRDVYAMANIVGGLVLVGVKETEPERGRPNTDRPDPGDVPGVEVTNRLSPSALKIKLRDRTRPSLVDAEVGSVEIPGREGRAVLIFRVPESLEAPHEVRLPAPEIPVRRHDKTLSAGVDDVERMIYRAGTGSAPPAGRRSHRNSSTNSSSRSPGTTFAGRASRPPSPCGPPGPWGSA
jgi:predicted HTH transcriptional regulator